MMCDLRRPDVWEPAQTNEAEYIDFEEWARHDIPFYGVTGIRRLGNLQIVYTPTAIFGVRYVGKPKIVQWDPLVEDRGSGLVYGLCGHASRHFFFDGVEGDFFAFDGQSVTSIGGPSIDKFVEAMSTDWTVAQQTWAYTRPEFQEAVWVFKTTGSTTYDKKLVYNWNTNEWHWASCEDERAFGGGTGQLVTSADSLVGTLNALVGTADAQGVSGTSVPCLWGSGDSYVLREVVDADAETTYLAQDEPYLVTPDVHMGTLDLVKELDRILVNAKYIYGDGIEVSMSVRESLTDTVEYKTMGVWKPGCHANTLDFHGLSGMV
jgi:hypothetical protein